MTYSFLFFDNKKNIILRISSLHFQSLIQMCQKHLDISFLCLLINNIEKNRANHKPIWWICRWLFCVSLYRYTNNFKTKPNKTSNSLRQRTKWVEWINSRLYWHIHFYRYAFCYPRIISIIENKKNYISYLV